MGKVTLQHRGRARHDCRRLQRATSSTSITSARTCASRTARRASTSGRCSSGASRCAARAADLVQIEVKRAAAAAARRRRPSSCRACSASAPRRATTQLLVIIAPNGRRVEFNDVTAPASSGTRPSASSKQRHLRRAALARHRRAARRRPDEAQRRNHDAHDHRRPAGMARGCELRWRPRQTTADRQAADAVPRRPARRAAGAVHELPLDRQGRGAQLRPAAHSAPATRSASSPAHSISAAR